MMPTPEPDAASAIVTSPPPVSDLAVSPRSPGSVHVAHTDHEFVHVSELDQAVDAYVRLATAAIAALPA
jgi:hypothetical protein